MERKVASHDTAGNPAKTRIVTSHKWLKCMEDFASHISPFWQTTCERYSESLGDGQGKDVKETESSVKKDVIVALIDDGVNFCDPSFGGRILEGKTFDYQGGSVGQCYVSARGHGTAMARMILRVCPMAKIYPIRLKTHSADGKTQIVAKTAAMVSRSSQSTGIPPLKLRGY